MFSQASVILSTGGEGMWQTSPPLPPPQETATAADGSYPTGMHSSYGTIVIMFLKDTIGTALSLKSTTV